MTNIYKPISLVLLIAVLVLTVAFLSARQSYHRVTERQAEAYRDSIGNILSLKSDTLQMYMDSLKRLKIADSINIKHHELKTSYLISLPADSLDSLFRATYPSN